MPQRSNSAADAAGLKRLGLCIARVKQPSAGGGETTAAYRQTTSRATAGLTPGMSPFR